MLNGSKTKLHLPSSEQIIYEKILFGEKLSGKEKDTEMFKLLHKLWSKIKTEQLQASKIFTMLNKINIYLVETEAVSVRDLYYSLNYGHRSFDQIELISNYLSSFDLEKEWKKFV